MLGKDLASEIGAKVARGGRASVGRRHEPCLQRPTKGVDEVGWRTRAPVVNYHNLEAVSWEPKGFDGLQATG